VAQLTPRTRAPVYSYTVIKAELCKIRSKKNLTLVGLDQREKREERERDVQEHILSD